MALLKEELLGGQLEYSSNNIDMLVDSWYNQLPCHIKERVTCLRH